MEHTASWSTWDVECLNAVMKAPELAEVRVSFYDARRKRLHDRMLWKYVERFGEHSVDGTYFDLDLKYEDVTFRVEFAAEGDRFVYKWTPDRDKEQLKLFVSGLYRWSRRGTVVGSDDSLLLEDGNSRFDISVDGAVDFGTPLNSNHPGILVSCSGSLYIRCNHAMDRAEMDRLLAARRAEWLRESVTGGGLLEDAPQAIVKGMTWNTIYDPTKRRFCTPVTREWCVMSNMTHFGGYVLFSWDTFLGSLLAAVQDKDFAYRQIYSVIEEMIDEFAPQYGSQVLTRWDRSNPPVGAYCVLRLYRQFNEPELLDQVYDKLLGWNRWWMKRRDGNGDGLLEWGSDRAYVENAQEVLGESFEVASKMESGLDNSPMYDGVAYNPQGRTLELADVGLNALYAADCRALAEMALVLGKEDDAALLLAEYERVKRAMNEELWNEELGMYCNKHWDGRFSDVLTPASFYPLMAGIPDRAQAERIVAEHLLNEEEFWGEYVLPAVMKNHPSFQDNDYWRGRVWGPFNFFVSEGLKRYGYDDLSYEMAHKSLRMFLAEWKEDNHIHENYNALTGDGDDVYNADPVYTWGGLLPYLYIQELVDAEPWGGIRFGNTSGHAASISGIAAGGDLYSVSMAEGLEVLRNGQPYIRVSVPARVRVGVNDKGETVFDVESGAAGHCEIRGCEGPIIVRYNGEERIPTSVEGGE